MVELVQDKVGHSLGDAGLLERRVSQRSLHRGFGHLKDAFSQELEQVEVDLLRVAVLFLIIRFRFVKDCNFEPPRGGDDRHVPCGRT